MSEDKRTWIFPPTLKQVRTQFEVLYSSLYKTADRRKPLMIIGDRGVGKSAFVDLFEDLYTVDNRAKVKRLNIASLPENLLISELFGHKKGAFTDAKIDKPGHFKTLGDGGLLILEEVGDISPQIQAKLLTVIEDGKYYPIGETERPERAKNIQIVCTTNKPRSAFREDFYDRFFRFKIPAIHERRQDILYYIGLIYPRLLESLSSTETLALLSYNWPGNVREIENFCSRVMWREMAIKHSLKDAELIVIPGLDELSNPSLHDIAYWMAIFREEDPRRKREMEALRRAHYLISLTDDGSGFDFYPDIDTWTNLIGENRVKDINRVLKKYRLALFDVAIDKKSFLGSTFRDLPEKYALPSDLKKAILQGDDIKIFWLVYLGFRHFCAQTDQHNIRENRNLLFPTEEKQSQEEKKVDVYAMKENDLLRDYYSNLLEMTRGNQKEAARRAGIGYGNFRKRLQKYNIVQ